MLLWRSYTFKYPPYYNNNCLQHVIGHKCLILAIVVTIYFVDYVIYYNCKNILFNKLFFVVNFTIPSCLRQLAVV